MTVAENVTSPGAQGTSELLSHLAKAAEAATTLCARATEGVAAKVSANGKIDSGALEREQHAAHGLAWIATYVEALNQLADYAKSLDGEGRFGEMERLLAQIGRGVDENRRAVRHVDDDRRAQAPVARVSRLARGAGAADHRHAVRRSGAEERDARRGGAGVARRHGWMMGLWLFFAST